MNKPPEITPDPIVRYTFWLVIVGVLQFAALVIQAFFFYKAFNETTTATGLTAQALVEARRSNAANEKLTLESNASAQAATELTRQSILLTHRPKLIVRTFFTEVPKAVGDAAPLPPSFNEGLRVDGQFYIVNVGDSLARISEIYVTVMLGWDVPMKRPYEGLTGDKYEIALRPGQSAPWRFRKDIPLVGGDVNSLREAARVQKRAGEEPSYMFSALWLMSMNSTLREGRRSAASTI